MEDCEFKKIVPDLHKRLEKKIVRVEDKMSNVDGSISALSEKIQALHDVFAISNKSAFKLIEDNKVIIADMQKTKLSKWIFILALTIGLTFMGGSFKMLSEGLDSTSENVSRIESRTVALETYLKAEGFKG